MAPSTASKPIFDGRLTRRQHLALGAIALCALALRLLYLWGQAENNPFFEIVRGDAYDHHAWAQAIAFGPGMEPEPYYRAPFYYHLLAGLYLVAGPSIVTARLAGACLGAITTYAIARLGAGLAGYRAGVLAGLLAAVYWPAIYFDGELLTVGLECLLEVALILALLVATRRNSLGLLALAGIGWGLCVITRPNFLALAPAILAWLFIALPGAAFAPRKWLAAGVVLIAAACVVAPVSLRNARVSDAPVLITYSGGVNFYIGNNPDSDGISAALPGGRRSLRGGYEDARRIPENELGRSLGPAEISDYWYGRGLDWMRSEPGAFAAHLVKKIRLFWSPVELPNNQPIRFFAGLSPISILFWVGFPLLAVLGLAGFALEARDWKRWFLPGAFLLIYMGTVVLFFCNARYRLPVYPLLAVAAGAGLSRLPRLFAEGRRGSLLLYAGVGLLAAAGLAMNPPEDRDAFHRANRGEGHKALGDLRAAAPLSDRQSQNAALSHFEAAVRLKPGSPHMHLALAREQSRLGQTGRARENLAAAVRRFPDNAEVRLELGRVLAGLAEPGAALEQFRAATELQPAYGAAQEELGCLLVRTGNPGRALEPLRSARQLLAEPFRTHLCLGDAQFALRDTDAALVEFAAAGEIGPDRAAPLLRMGDTHLLRGEVEPAILDYRSALERQANLPATSQNLAAALRRTSRYAEVIAVLEEAIEYSPRDGELLAALAFARATSPLAELRQGERSLELAKRAAAAQRTPSVETLDARAAALAELGRFEAATMAVQEALASARAGGRIDLVPRLEARLTGYRANRPYRDPLPSSPPLP